MKKFIQNASLGKTKPVYYLITILSFFVVIFYVGQFAFAEAMHLKGIPKDELMNYTLAESRDLMGKNLFLIVNLLPFVALFVFILLSVKYLHQRPILSVFTGRESFDWKRFFTSFALFGVLLSVGLIYGLTQGNELKWNYNPENFWMLLGISIFILPLQMAIEEVFFRGYLLQGIAGLFHKPIASILITSLFFAVLHLENPEVVRLGEVLVIYYFMCGLFMALLTVLDNGLELSLGFHTINNIFGTLIITNNWQVFQTDALYMDVSEPKIGWELWVTVLIYFPLMLFFFHKKYKWGSWSEILFQNVREDNHDLKNLP
jgi:membrane protease YdiL (CAAX protease family)